MPVTASAELPRPICRIARPTQADRDTVTTSVPRQSNDTASTGELTTSKSHPNYIDTKAPSSDTNQCHPIDRPAAKSGVCMGRLRAGIDTNW
jgi:hypothetical protein